MIYVLWWVIIRSCCPGPAYWWGFLFRFPFYLRSFLFCPDLVFSHLRWLNHLRLLFLALFAFPNRMVRSWFPGSKVSVMSLYILAEDLEKGYSPFHLHLSFRTFATGLIDMCVLWRDLLLTQLDLILHGTKLPWLWTGHILITGYRNIKSTVSMDRINQLLILPGMNRIHTATAVKWNHNVSSSLGFTMAPYNE